MIQYCKSGLGLLSPPPPLSTCSSGEPPVSRRDVQFGCILDLRGTENLKPSGRRSQGQSIAGGHKTCSELGHVSHPLITDVDVCGEKEAGDGACLAASSSQINPLQMSWKIHFFWHPCPAEEKHFHKMPPFLCCSQELCYKSLFSSPLPSPKPLPGDLYMARLICAQTPAPEALCPGTAHQLPCPWQILPGNVGVPSLQHGGWLSFQGAEV